MTMRTLAVLALVAAGCAAQRPGWTRPEGDHRYPSTDPNSIAILSDKPPGAEVVGEVHGVRSDRTAVEDALHRASELGAHAIVWRAQGDQHAPNWPYDPWSVEFVQATAVRLPR